MMWRLNFFVFFVCLAMRNDYVLYYICPMHTLFTWAVYFVLYVGVRAQHEHQRRPRKIRDLLRRVLRFVGDTRVFTAVFGPFQGLFQRGPEEA